VAPSVAPRPQSTSGIIALVLDAYV